MTYSSTPTTTRLNEYRDQDGKYTYRLPAATPHEVREELVHDFMDQYGAHYVINYGDSGGAESYLKFRAEREGEPQITLYVGFTMNTFETDPEVVALKNIFWRYKR